MINAAAATTDKNRRANLITVFMNNLIANSGQHMPTAFILMFFSCLVKSVVNRVCKLVMGIGSAGNAVNLIGVDFTYDLLSVRLAALDRLLCFIVVVLIFDLW